MTDRIKAHALDPAGGTAGQVPTINPAGTAVDWGTPAGGGGSLTVQDENGNVSTGVTQIDFQGAGVTATAGTGEVVVTIPGGGGGGSGATGTAPDGAATANTLPASANAKDDEFNDATGMSGGTNGLNAKWGKRNLATAGWVVLSTSVAPGSLLFDVPTGQAADQAIHQAAPSGDFRVTTRLSLVAASDRQMWGPVIVDSSGNGIGVFVDDPTGDASTNVRGISGWNITGTVYGTASTKVNAAWNVGAPVFLSLRKSGGTYYASSWVSDRILPNTLLEVSAVPSAFTPAYIGAGRAFGGGTSRVLLDWFRVS